jgi:hypothetical protein
VSVRLTSTSTSNYAYLVRNITAESIATNQAFTICGWFKPVVWVTYNPMLSATNTLASRSDSIEMYGQGDGSSPDAAYFGIGSSGYTGTYSFANGDWVYRAFVYTGSGFNNLHYAGNASGLTETSGIGYGLSAAINYIVVGELGQPAVVQAFSGEVEHIRVWKTTLSAAELATERDATTPQKASCFLAWSCVNAADTADITGNSRVWTGTTVGSGTITNGASNSPPGAYSASSSAPVGIIRPRQQFAFSSAIARY